MPGVPEYYRDTNLASQPENIRCNSSDYDIELCKKGTFDVHENDDGYTCREPTTNRIILCNKYTMPGVPEYYRDTNLASQPENIRCNSSDYDIELCKKDCGRVIYREEDQVTDDGNVTKREYMPWHVSIYEQNAGDFSYLCGGTLIANSVIISAADCFWDEEKGFIRFSEYGAAAGQTYRLWSDERNIHAQQSSVITITVPKTYKGKSQAFQHDLAVLVTRPFTFNTHIRHVCLNWDDDLDEQQELDANIGKIAGWGQPTLQVPLSRGVAELKSVQFYICDSELPRFQADQICANYTRGNRQFMSSNLGSGLVFIHNSTGIDRYYLRGVLTTKCLNENFCFPQQNYATFTRVTRFKEFIQQYTKLYNDTIVE